MEYKYKIHNKQRVFNGFFKVDKYTVSHNLFRGGDSQPFTRELFERGNAVSVLPYDPLKDSVVLVEQFRIGALASKNSPWQIETIAGVIDKDGESPEDVAKREAEEEANCKVSEMIPICQYFCSPGGTSEKIHLFCAEIDSENIGGVFGLDEENEDIKVHVIDFQKAMDMIGNSAIETAMTIISLQWLALNKDKIFK
ncbi:MAG: NUDIX domain-containing protein [Gammaproteobacteria bacterium]|nr:MAG: NUDIX domain-containing protein [Gammaproteobacteria bacterium]